MSIGIRALTFERGGSSATEAVRAQRPAEDTRSSVPCHRPVVAFALGPDCSPLIPEAMYCSWSCGEECSLSDTEEHEMAYDNLPTWEELRAAPYDTKPKVVRTPRL